MRLTNCLTGSFRNITPHQRHRLSPHMFRKSVALLKESEREFVCFRLLRFLVSFRNHRTRMRRDLFCIYNLLYLQTHFAPGCRFFLYHYTTRTFSRNLDNDFTSHKTKMIQRPLRSASFTIRCLSIHASILILRIAHNCYQFLLIHKRLQEIAYSRFFPRDDVRNMKYRM